MSKYNDFMKQILSLISKIHKKGNDYIVEQLKQNGADGLVPSHGDILIVLYKKDKMSMKDIAKEIHRTKPTVTVLVDKLEKLGFVKREISGDDSRCTNIVLTKKGKDFKPVFEKISKNLNDTMYKNLTESEIAILDILLEKMLK